MKLSQCFILSILLLVFHGNAWAMESLHDAFEGKMSIKDDGDQGSTIDLQSVGFEKAYDFLSRNWGNNETKQFSQKLVKIFLNKPDKKGNTFLLRAVTERNAGFAQYLIQMGFAYDAKNSQGETPHDIARKASNQEILTFLDANQDLLCFACTPHGNKYLEKRIKAFLDKGACINVRTKDGFTPLHHAALSRGNELVIQQFLAVGADVNAQDYVCGMTSLAWAAFWGHPKNVQSLLDARADRGIVDRYGNTLFDNAVSGYSSRRATLDMGTQADYVAILNLLEVQK